MARSAAILALGFLLGLIAGRLLPRGTKDVAPPPDGQHARPLAADDAPHRGERRVRVAPRAEAVSRDDVPVPAAHHGEPVASPPWDSREVILPDAPAGFDDLDVEVVDAEGAPAHDVHVYALPAGAPGRDDEDTLPREFTGADGRCRLTLLGPVDYDITAQARYVLARAEGVRVPGTGTIRLQLPPSAVAVFALDEERPPPADVSFRIRSAGGPALRYHPGRGELLHSVEWKDSIGPGDRRREVSLGPGEFVVTQEPAYEVRDGVSRAVPPKHVVTFDPARFVPPATIRVRAAGTSAPTLEPALTFVQPKETPSLDRVIDYRLEVDEGTEPSHVHADRVRFAFDGKATAAVELKLPVRGRSGVLRWSGPSLVPGSASWDLDLSPVVRATIDVRPPTEQECVRLHVNLPAEAASDSGRVTIAFEDPDDPDYAGRGRVPVGVDVLLDIPEGWLLVDVDEGDGPLVRLVAGPVNVRRGRSVTLTPRRGGFVVFAPGMVAPERSGDTTVARADRAPLLSAENRPTRRVCVVPGTVLGPFEPGVVVLDVFVGPVLWGRYEVTVREGAWTTLTPRRFAERR